MTLTATTPPGPGYIPPARVHAPAGQAQSSRSPRMLTQQAQKEFVAATTTRPALKHVSSSTCSGPWSSVTQGVSRTQMAPAVWHTVPSFRRTCWVRTPSASHGDAHYVPTHLRTRLPINVHTRATSEGVSSISRGGVLAHCRGFGTCGWTDAGDPSTRSRLWDPLPWRYDSESLERPQRPVGCPSTLARGVGAFLFGATRSPVLRIRAHSHPFKDGEGGPRAGLGRPGQTFRQPDAKSSARLAGPSLLRARARLNRGA
jgi:hypothetical protein